MDKIRITELHAVTPYRLIEFVSDSESEATANHLFLYNALWMRANWKRVPIETNRLCVRTLLEKMPFDRRHFYRLLKYLINENFIERVYDKDKARSKYLKIRFLIHVTHGGLL